MILSAATFKKREDAIFVTLFRAEGDSQLRWTWTWNLQAGSEVISAVTIAATPVPENKIYCQHFKQRVKTEELSQKHRRRKHTLPLEMTHENMLDKIPYIRTTGSLCIKNS